MCRILSRQMPQSWKQYIVWSVAEGKTNCQFMFNLTSLNRMACTKLYKVQGSMAPFKPRMVIFDPKIHAKVRLRHIVKHLRPAMIKTCFTNAKAIAGVS